jgi:RNA-directed DNA polymerase
LPLGNLTSQLFANVYLDAFDHFVKEELCVKRYIRYTDDMIVVHENPTYLNNVLEESKQWLWTNRRLRVHPYKQEVRKLRQGIDFLGYVTLPHHRVVRTKARRRMMSRLNQENLTSYMGVCLHANCHALRFMMINESTIHGSDK